MTSFHNVTPARFEDIVAAFLRKCGAGLPGLLITRLEKIPTAQGSFEIDVVARFEAFSSSFVVLVECKKHRSAIKRDVVQVLRDRLDAVGAHKGMLFSTSRFQSGAVEYAKIHQIALVQLTEKGAVYITKRRLYHRVLRAPPIRIGNPHLMPRPSRTSGSAPGGVGPVRRHVHQSLRKVRDAVPGVLHGG